MIKYENKEYKLSKKFKASSFYSTAYLMDEGTENDSDFKCEFKIIAGFTVVGTGCRFCNGTKYS